MKKQVHYAIMEDMKKYVADFNPRDYEETSNRTDYFVTEFLREYYDNHLPVDVTAWMRVNEPRKELIFAKGLSEQVCLVRDMLCSLLHPSYEEWYSNPPMVISTHCSKSVKLPVFQIKLEKYGIEIILRYNFYDWKVSVNSEKPLDFDFMGLFDENKEILSVYCEGFPLDKVYGSYKKNKSKFTIKISSHYNLYTFFYLLKNHLGI